MEAKTVSVSEFKATCLRLFEEIRRTGQPIIVTKRGEPIAQVVPPPSPARGGDWLGCLRGSGRIAGDIVAPAFEPEEWERHALAEWDDLTSAGDESPQ